MTRDVTAGAVSAQGIDSPSFRVRTVLPAEELRRLGVRVEPFPLFDAAEDARFRSGGVVARARTVLGARRRLADRLSRGSFEVALVQRQVDLLPTYRLDSLAIRGRRVVLDVDDAVWHDTRPGAGGSFLARLKRTERKILWMLARADAVVAGNALLAEWLSRYSPHVTVIPSLVEHRSAPIRTHETGDRVVLGWIGSMTTARHLEPLAGPLEALAAAQPQKRFELCIVGGRPLRLKGIDVTARPWSEATERELLERMDIGLMPLPDNEFTRGKCAYKALQYMASGVPVVADDVGITAEVVGQDRAGLIADGPSEWTSALAALADDAGLRSRLGSEGRRRVARDFSIERWAPALASVIRGDRPPVPWDETGQPRS
jgi:glycosyltransferase involved in cell wall biosynthesis